MKKIDIENSLIYRFDVFKDLVECTGLLGASGCFSDDKDFNEYDFGTLSEVRVRHLVKDGNYLFVSGNDETDVSCYKYFIPEDKVVFIEEQSSKKFRPYNYLRELPFGIGDSIAIRVKAEPSSVTYVLVDEIVCTGDRVDYLSFGTSLTRFSPKYYFDGYEFLMNGEWVPFGVEE